MASLPQQYPEPPAPTRAIHVGDETVIVLDADLALVASTSETDVWHVVERDRCDCKGFRYREACKHLGIAARARGGVKKGERPAGWGGPALFDEAELAGVAPAADTELSRIFGGL